METVSSDAINSTDAGNRRWSGVSIIDPSDPLYVHPSDNLGMKLVSKVFDGEGFSFWRRSMLIALSAMNKIGFINGSIIKPDHDSPNLRNWEMCNAMVMSWILNALDKGIADSVWYASTAEEIWSELNSRFGTSRGAQAYEIEKELCSLSQGQDDIIRYFTKIKKLWGEMNALREMPPCTCGCIQTIIGQEQERRLFQFLMGLNDSFSIIKGNILMMNPLPSISQAYSMLVKEEQLRKIHASSQLTTDAASSYVSNQRNVEKNKRSLFSCNYCKKPGHTIDRCYKLHGYPSDGKRTKGKVTAAAAAGSTVGQNATAVPGLTNEEYNNQLQKNAVNKSQLKSSATLLAPSMKRVVPLGRAGRGLFLLES